MTRSQTTISLSQVWCRNCCTTVPELYTWLFLTACAIVLGKFLGRLIVGYRTTRPTSRTSLTRRVVVRATSRRRGSWKAHGGRLTQWKTWVIWTSQQVKWRREISLRQWISSPLGLSQQQLSHRVRVLRPTWHKIDHFGWCSSQPVSWLSTEEIKPNTTKADNTKLELKMFYQT